VKFFAWDDAKNAKLKSDRGIGFEDIVFHIQSGGLLDILEHPNPDRYAGQRISSSGARTTSVKRPTMKLDADEKELLESSSKASGSLPALASASGLATLDMRRVRSARTGG
jgi:hypothetical protein